MNSNERQQYITEVVKAVYGKEPEEARVPTMEWGLIADWMDRDVPLRVVLQGIENMEKVGSIRHARPAIEQEIDRWHQAIPH